MIGDVTIDRRATLRSRLAPTAADTAIVGISGQRRNASVAVAVGGQLRAFCEQERVTRVRRAALECGYLPEEALAAALAAAGVPPSQVRAYVTAEDRVALPPSLARVELGHHFAHAATAFFTSPFEDAAVLVCDQHSDPPVSVWLASGIQLIDMEWPWTGPGFAGLYSEFAKWCGGGTGQEHHVEALARLSKTSEQSRFARFFTYRDGTLRVDPRWRSSLMDGSADQTSRVRFAGIASEFQRHLGACLLELVAEIRTHVAVNNLCLAGGLFYNTYFNTLLAESGVFGSTFVSPNPGNPGIAVGAALAVSQGPEGARERTPVPLFLGPEYDDHEIKRVLDNCKLTYDHVSEAGLIEATVAALQRGLLVGWFQGRMEWGHRALGNRSILASPLSPYVLENLNAFLKHREPYRAYGVSVCIEDLAELFDGPPLSRSMEYEYRPRDSERVRHILPPGSSTLRVQSIDAGPARLRDVHTAFKAQTGLGVLVNTSFNGFSEPIVCSPRDAIRVFYGSGLDVLILGRFVIRK